ncbi:hypothetical protein ACLKA7_005974 [Drosophila subpalustris]
MECDDDDDYDNDEYETPQEQGPIWRLNLFLKRFSCKLYQCIYQYIYTNHQQISQLMFWKHKLTVQNVTEFNETCNWYKATIRRIIFNPCGYERVLLTGDDRVVYFYDKLMPATTLRFYRQININCGAFRPWSGHDLIVGGSGGMCLWHKSNVELPLSASWIGLKDREDFVTDLQWLHGGHHLACALLNARCIQLWQPEKRQVMLEIQMQCADSYLWALRFKPDIQELFYHLKIDEEDFDSFSDWETNIKGSKVLQSACWSNRGHLLYLTRNCCKVFSCTPHAEHGIFLHPSDEWYSETALDLSFIEVDGQRYNCRHPQAIAIDLYDVHVAIVFNRQPHVLICLHHAGFGCYVRMRPFRVISCTPDFNLYPTCCTFAVDYAKYVSDYGDSHYCDDYAACGDEIDINDDHLRQLSISLFIGWSSGYVQEVPVKGRTVKEALSINYR